MANHDDVLLTQAQVLDAIGLRCTWLKHAAAEGRFPVPVRFGTRALFSRREVQEWIERRKAER